MRDLVSNPSLIGAVCVLLLLCSFAVVTQAAPPEGATQRVSENNPVDLNKATAERLTGIPGIGSVTAERIVAWRDKHGPFKRVDDLMKVKGIGEKSLEKIRPFVKVSKGR